MRVLVVTNLYPTPSRPYICPFVKEQVEAMRGIFPDMTIDVRIIEGLRPRWAYLRDMVQLPVIGKKSGYDLVHAHFGLTLVSTLFLSLPVVVTFHGSDLLVNPTKHLSRLLAPRTSKVIVVAERLRQSLGYGEVIPCGIDVEKFALPSHNVNLSSLREPGKLRILFPADPERKIKNYGLFVAVCEELERRGSRIERIHLANVPRANVPSIFWKCDVMILTSYSEGSPTVIKEAIAAKLPFVSVDVGDVKEWADRIEFGVVTHSKEPNTIADAVVSLLSRTTRRNQLDNSGCIDMIDIMNSARRVRAVYDEVLTGR